MKRYSLTASLLLAAIAIVAMDARTVHAELRQVAFASASLQAKFTGASEVINTDLDQALDAQRWACTVSGNSAVTLMFELAADAQGNSIGVYDANLALTNHYPIFPGTAQEGDFAVASFRSAPNRLVVNLFDHNATLQNTITYLGVSIHDFGYYIDNPNAGKGYTQDARNAGEEARVLAYRGTGRNVGNWWLCFEDKNPQDDDQDRDFDDAVLFVESINPTAVSKSTWGALKSRFR